MDKIELLESDDRMWFLVEINRMVVFNKYKIIHLNTFIENDHVVWIAILEKQI